MLTHCSFDVTKNKLDYYRDKECLKVFCKDLKKHVTKIVTYEKKKTIPLTYEENKSHHKQKISYICKKEFSTKEEKSKIIVILI